MIHTALLKQFPLFKVLDDSTLQIITAKMHRKDLQAGEVLFHKGDTSRQLYFLFSGKLKVTDLSEEGREVTLAYILPGQHIGELAVIDNQPRSATIQAEEPSTLLYLDHENALHLFTCYPGIALAIMKHLAGTIRSNNRMRQILATPNTKVRIYRYLLTLIGKAVTIQASSFKLPKHSEIAQSCNTSRETVSRAINALVKNQIATKPNPHTLHIDTEALQQYIQQLEEK